MKFLIIKIRVLFMFFKINIKSKRVKSEDLEVGILKDDFGYGERIVIYFYLYRF